MIRILIVDNEITFRKGLAVVLENISDDISLSEAANGIEFLEMISRNLPDLVFMDIKMPEMDGIEATSKATLMHPDLWIYGFSTHENQGYRNRMLQAGAKGYLSKMQDNYDALVNIIQHAHSRYNQLITKH